MISVTRVRTRSVSDIRGLTGNNSRELLGMSVLVNVVYSPDLVSLLILVLLHVLLGTLEDVDTLLPPVDLGLDGELGPVGSVLSLPLATLENSLWDCGEFSVRHSSERRTCLETRESHQLINMLLSDLLSPRHGSDDIRVSGVSDTQGAHTEIFSTSGPQLVVVASVVVDTGLGQHGVVLDLGLAERGSVVGDDHQLALPIPQGLEGLLVAQAILAGLHHKRQPGVDGLIGLLVGFLGCNHLDVLLYFL